MGGEKYLLVILACVIPVYLTPSPIFDSDKVHYFKTGEILQGYRFDDVPGTKSSLQIFCRAGEVKSLRYFFRTATLRIISSSDDIRIFNGASEAEVYLKYLSASKWFMWAADLLPWRVREASFPTFNSSCVGIETSKSYSATLLIRPIDPWKFALFVSGIGLFLLSPRLAESTAFFYTSGTLLGAVAAALVFLFILSRALPKGKVSYITISILWSMCLYFAGESWNRLEELFHEKLPYILVYLTTGAVIAFITCYRLGPPKHPRTLDIIRWFLQLVSLGLIHLSSELVEVSTAIIVIILFSYYFLGRWIQLARGLWRRWFPAPVRLLTEEEYIAQGSLETEKSLKQLREYCSSPECNSWKIVSRLKDPRRFSSFVSGTSHLSDEELMSFETELLPSDVVRPEETSDEDESDLDTGVDMRRRGEDDMPANVARSPSRQGTPRPLPSTSAAMMVPSPAASPATVTSPPPNQRHARALRSRNSTPTTTNGRVSSRAAAKARRTTANEYLTDDESPGNSGNHISDSD